MPDLRTIEPRLPVAARAGVQPMTRLRVTEDEHEVLSAIAAMVGSAQGKDRSVRSVRSVRSLRSLRSVRSVRSVRSGQGRSPGKEALATRKRNLETPGTSVETWRQEWSGARDWFHANGSADEPHGNLTITITPEGAASLRLPRKLEHLSNTPRGRYTLAHPVHFAHNHDAWRQQIATGTAFYRFTHVPDRDGWYVSASFPRPQAPLPAARGPRTVGVDTNADHLAAWVLDRHGNPTAGPRRSGWDMTDSSTRRDAQICHTITRLLPWTIAHGADRIVIENLGFEDARATGRETMGRDKRGKTCRRTVAGILALKLHNRLAAMSHRAGVQLIAVDPAHTSRWGEQHWRRACPRPLRDHPTRGRGHRDRKTQTRVPCTPQPARGAHR